MIKKIAKKIYNNWLRRQQKLHLMHIDRPTFIHRTATFNFHQGIKIGKYCRIGNECHIDGEGGVEIGDGTILAPKVVILSSSHDYKQDNLLPYGFNDEKLPVIIGKGCWLGWGAMVRPGITIGDGAIVAMGSVVTKDVARGALVGGNPAKFIKEAHQNDVINSLLAENKYYLKKVIESRKARNGRESVSFKDLV